MEASDEPAQKLTNSKEQKRERAIYLAMAALYEIANRTGEGPITPSLALRALLAFLYLHSNGDTRSFVGFWRECQNPWAGHHQPDYCRATYTRTQWEGIAAATGFDLMPAYRDGIHKVVHPEDKKPKRGDCGWL